jgi:hypothetical protein
VPIANTAMPSLRLQEYLRACPQPRHNSCGALQDDRQPLCGTLRAGLVKDECSLPKNRFSRVGSRSPAIGAF